MGLPEKSSLCINSWASFHILSITLLSLLLPLSFILLARLSLLSEIPTTQSHSPSLLSCLYLLFLAYFDAPFLYATVSTVSLAALYSGLTKTKETVDHSNLRFEWTALIILQFCVGFAVERSLSVDCRWGTVSTYGRSLWVTGTLFLGLHETMLFWSRRVVKPVVDDTLYGELREEGWIQRGAMTASFGGLWWFVLRHEVDLLAFVGEIKKEVQMNGFPEMIVWWLYYVAIAVGVMRIFKVIKFLGVLFVFRGRPSEDDYFSLHEEA